MTASTTFTLIGVLVAGTIVGTLEYRSRSNIVTAGFWFDDDVSFELHDPARIGGPLNDEERQRIVTVAREEVVRAFAELRLAVTERRDAFYRVRVRQALTVGRRYAAAGQSNVFGPLGGHGAVSFVTLAAQAISYAPQTATRAQIVDAIGRGLGRAAVHEFAHQILPKDPIHRSQDRASFEYWSSDRAAQYYGEMHWSVAREALRERLGR